MSHQLEASAGCRVIVRRSRSWALAVLALLALCCAGCQPSRPDMPLGVPIAVGGSAAPQTLPLPDGTTPNGAYEGSSEYRIGAHDLLQITVFQVPEISPTVRVNSSGMISLPLIGSVQAGGKTTQELETEIAGRLAKGFVKDPQVTVFVQEFTSQRVTVEGAVNKPGIFPITGKITLMQTVALAEGLDPLADPESVVIFRDIKGKKMAALFDLTKIQHGEMADPLIYGDDIVVIDKSGSRTFLKGITDTLRGFVGFRTY
jgi:polysaccharide export outer membrane protein